MFCIQRLRHHSRRSRYCVPIPQACNQTNCFHFLGILHQPTRKVFCRSQRRYNMGWQWPLGNLAVYISPDLCWYRSRHHRLSPMFHCIWLLFSQHIHRGLLLTSGWSSQLKEHNVVKSKKWFLSVNKQASVVQKMDSAIHRINLYPVDSAMSFPNTYPLDSDLSDG